MQLEESIKQATEELDQLQEGLDQLISKDLEELIPEQVELLIDAINKKSNELASLMDAIG